HAPGVGQALLAGAGVGVAGANDHTARIGPRQPRATDLYRRGRDAVLSEDAGAGSGAVADNQGQVAPIGFRAQPADDAGETVALGQGPVCHGAFPSAVWVNALWLYGRRPERKSSTRADPPPAVIFLGGPG